MGHIPDRVDVDQRAHEGDEQHKQDRELVNKQPHSQIPRPDVDKSVDPHVDSTRRTVTSEQVDKKDQPDDEGDDRDHGGQHMPPRVAAASQHQ